MIVQDRLELSVRLVIECLQTLGANYEPVNWQREGSTARASVSSKKDGTQIDIIGVSIEQDKKCMVSLFNSDDDRSLGQAMFRYDEDLGISQDMSLPLEYESYRSSIKNDELIHVLRRIGDKLRFEVPAELKEVETEQVMQRGSTSLARDTSQGDVRPFKRPPDMPGFEDEYQIHEERTQPVHIPGPESGYGDTDLYPTGQKYPNLADPTTQMPPVRPGHPQGGMTFDPLRDQAKRQEEEEGKLRGPGWIPGAKYDDPYGHPSFGNSGTGSSGFGFGGFI
ncbi:hypothetical protein HG537_0F00520 [Torulaspora globosa]|uniref:PI31 proteasome regulator C-terminal domain-containing protein n=1 Tax=Torulaspora globosa TaxID=48254 RepID=A0A7H9HV98_9SACH|nr:hypothetical protein HG537_0F00520 [Torulaspora sp. CBS 2947]